jgi:hypothetical protein
MMDGAHEAGCGAASSECCQPVVVGLVRMDHVDPEVPQGAPHPADLGRKPPGQRGPLERESLQQRHAGLADVGLEHVAAGAPEPD